jgi:hypothetical protein
LWKLPTWVTASPNLSLEPPILMPALLCTRAANSFSLPGMSSASDPELSNTKTS